MWVAAVRALIAPPAAAVRVQMRSERDRPGRIFPPLLTLTYGVLRADQAEAEAAATVRLRVQYSMDMANSREQIEVGVDIYIEM